MPSLRCADGTFQCAIPPICCLKWYSPRLSALPFDCAHNVDPRGRFVDAAAELKFCARCARLGCLIRKWGVRMLGLVSKLGGKREMNGRALKVEISTIYRRKWRMPRKNRCLSLLCVGLGCWRASCQIPTTESEICFKIGWLQRLKHCLSRWNWAAAACAKIPCQGKGPGERDAASASATLKPSLNSVGFR